MRRNATTSGNGLTAALRVLAVVLVMPFVLLSLMAQGTMMTRDAARASFAVVLCGDHQPVEMVLNDHGDVVPADEYRGSHDIPAAKGPCDWSAHAQPMLDAPPAPNPAVLAPARPVLLAPAVDMRLRRAQVLTPLARGPPAA